MLPEHGHRNPQRPGVCAPAGLDSTRGFERPDSVGGAATRLALRPLDGNECTTQPEQANHDPHDEKGAAAVVLLRLPGQRGRRRLLRRRCPLSRRSAALMVRDGRRRSDQREQHGRSTENTSPVAHARIVGVS